MQSTVELNLLFVHLLDFVQCKEERLHRFAMYALFCEALESTPITSMR
jgi:hypothetical protein